MPIDEVNRKQMALLVKVMPFVAAENQLRTRRRNGQSTCNGVLFSDVN